MATGRRPIRRQQAIFAVCLTLLVIGCREGRVSSTATSTTRAKAGHFYSTTFPRSEKPISESGNWVGGSDAGASFWAGGSFLEGERLWGNVQTVSGFSYGVDEPTKYGDPTAILTGTWSPTQTATATVKLNKIPTGGCCHEVELRLRTTIADHSITGYEAYCSVMPDKPYCHIARWNGPNGSYWNFETGNSSAYLSDGDVIRATATGANPTVITLYKNGTQILQATDSGAAGGGFGAFGPWTSGNPGIGFYDDHDSHWKDFGLSSFSATDGTELGR
ncbi:hypothetical protein H7849_12530 [Alloacidobacterium dinghuense]|uniref:Uncharacterized protein n=1 Tax=Alloacidobacterium dinghuense TaxID=2763107 RepID=A0A7G8BQ23_9BACT|nr:hypothetical protein [Alloacidobacterium dinghuense]QNI34643.1 hypothetical protein H7849_12530 [Alloacidobacterium dinghuense]